jgi:hypothetical protein
MNTLDSWVSQNEAKQQNNIEIQPLKKVDKLKDYRDQRWNKGEKRHPDDAKLEEIQEEYLKLNYDL